MFSLKKTKEIYHSPLAIVSEVDLEGNCLMTDSKDLLLNIQADEIFNKAEAGEDGLGRGTNSSYIEI